MEYSYERVEDSYNVLELDINKMCMTKDFEELNSLCCEAWRKITMIRNLNWARIRDNAEI